MARNPIHGCIAGHDIFVVPEFVTIGILQIQPYQNKKTRNTDIYRRYQQGEPLEVLAHDYDLSVSRIRWIIQHMRRQN